MSAARDPCIAILYSFLFNFRHWKSTNLWLNMLQQKLIVNAFSQHVCILLKSVLCIVGKDLFCANTFNFRTCHSRRPCFIGRKTGVLISSHLIVDISAARSLKMLGNYTLQWLSFNPMWRKWVSNTLLFTSTIERCQQRTIARIFVFFSPPKMEQKSMKSP